MTAPLVQVPIEHVTAGCVVSYGGDVYRVAEVLDVAMLHSVVLVGNPSDGADGWRRRRVALIYHVGGPAELLAGGPR